MKTKLLALAAVAALGACATVTRGTTNQVQIRSEPSGAQVRTSLAHTCTTPCTITVNRKEEFAATVSLDGFVEERIEVKTRVAGEGVAGFVGNVIVGGVIGMGVDAATGSTLEHFPNPVVVMLKPARPATPPSARGGRNQPRPAATRPPAPAPAAAPPAEEPPPPPPPRPETPVQPLGPGVVPSST